MMQKSGHLDIIDRIYGKSIWSAGPLKGCSQPFKLVLLSNGQLVRILSNAISIVQLIVHITAGIGAIVGTIRAWPLVAGFMLLRLNAALAWLHLDAGAPGQERQDLLGLCQRLQGQTFLLHVRVASDLSSLQSCCCTHAPIDSMLLMHTDSATAQPQPILSVLVLQLCHAERRAAGY